MSKTKTLLPNAGHQARVKAFAEALSAADGAACIWFGSEDCLWHVRAETPAGLFQLERPDGSGFPGLEGLLSLLAGEGVTRIMIEFNGVHPLYYDKIN